MSAAKSCASCERPLRKGSIKRATVLQDDGRLAVGLVCSRCALRAIAIVVPPPTTVAPACTFCRRKPAAICSECAERLGANVRELLAANIARVPAVRR